jgi:two-component system response regulator YesN
MVVALERIRDQILHGRRHQHERTPRRQWLAQLLLDGAPDQDTLRTGLSRMGLPLDEGHARVLLIQVEVAPRGDDMAVEPAGSKVDLEVDLERALDAVVTARGRAAWTPLRPGVWAVVGTLDPSCSDVDATREMADVVQRLQSQLDPNLIVSCGLSDLRADLAQAPLALADAEQALASRFYLGAGRLLTKQPAWSSISPELEAKLDQVAAMQRPADATFARHAGVLLGETCALCKEHWIDPEQARLLMIGMMQRLAATLRVDISPWDMALWPLQAAQAVTAQQLETWALQIIGVLTTSLEHYTMRPEIRKAVMHIRSCLSAPHDLNSAAKLAGLHPNYFSAVFHDETGQTFTEYLSRLRMERAAEYLREGAWKINQIAEMVGVPNYRTFFNMFHRVMGASPTEYKRRLDG